MQCQYKNLDVYKISYALAINLYRLVDNFPEHTKGNIASQLRRAASSVPLNIAEGSTKKSPKEFLVYLHHAFGSTKELEVLLMMSKDLGYLHIDSFEGLMHTLDRLMAQLFRYMESIEAQFSPRRRFYTTFHFEKLSRFR